MKGERKGMRKRWLVRSIGLFLFAIIALKIDWTNIVTLLSEMKLVWLAVSFLLIFPFVALKAWRWVYLLSLQDIRYSFHRAFLIYSVGIFLGLVTPGRLGDLMKVVYLKKDHNVPTSRGFSSVIIDRLCDLVVLILAASLGVVFLALSKSVLFYSIGFGLVLLSVTTLFLHRSFGSKLFYSVFKLPGLSRIEERGKSYIDSFYEGLQDFRSTRIWFPLAVSVCAFLLLFLQAYVLAYTLRIPLTFFECAACISITNLVMLIPISISGLGTRDGVMILLFSLLGFGKESAVAFSLMFLFIFTLSAGSVGAFAWFREPVDVRSLMD